MKAISLFSGMGGDALGMKQAGYDVVAYSEIDKFFRETHDKNFPNCKLIGNGDIMETTDEEFLEYKGKVDLIFAGFPCQGFSHAGKKLPDDPRNTLFREFVRSAKLIEPKYIIGENVKGLKTRKTSDGQFFIDIIEQEFVKLGYTVSYQVIKCHEYGVPQKRERLFIVGVKDGPKYKFPEPTMETVGLKDIVEFSMECSIDVQPEDFDFSCIPSECVVRNLDDTSSGGDPHPNLKNLTKQRDYKYREKEYPIRLSFGKRASGVHGEVVDIRNPSKTIICTYGRQPRLFVPIQNANGNFLRCFTVDELKQIQAFPKDYHICGNKTKQITQIGNAVPPLIVKILCESF